MADEEELAAALAMSLEGQAPAAEEKKSAAEEAAAVLLGNPAATLQETDAVEVIKKLLGNLSKAPADPKFRKIKVANARISKVLSCPGAEALLLAAGFQRAEEVLEIPDSRPEEEVGTAVSAALAALGVREPFVLAAQLRVGSPVRCTCALPGGGFATGALDNIVRVYKPGQFDNPVALTGHKQRAGVDGVLSVVPDAGDLVSAGRDGNIILWRDGLQWQQWGVLSGHGEGIQGTNAHVVSCLGRRSDGALLSGGWDKTIRAWDCGEQVTLMQGHTVAVNSVIGLPSGDVVSGSGDQSIGIWREAERLRSLSLQSPVRSLCACGERLFVSGGNDGLLRLWEAPMGKQLAECRVSESYVLSLAYCPSTRELAAGSDDGALAIVSLEGAASGKPSLKLVETLRHCGEVYGVAFLESGDLTVACGDGSSIVWTRSALRAAPAVARAEFAAAAKALEVAKGGASAAAPQGPTASGKYNMSSPVELGGRKMMLEWNRGEPPQAVAQRFLSANALDQRHAGDVVAFIMHAEQQQMAGGGGGGASQGGKDFNYPVEVADGRRLTISWNRGEDPQTVAYDFAAQHGGIAANELPDIVAFIQQVSGGPAPQPMMAQQAPSVSPAMQQQAIQQVMEMGFDAASARQALVSSGWSVEAAVQRLLS